MAHESHLRRYGLENSDPLSDGYYAIFGTTAGLSEVETSAVAAGVHAVLRRSWHAKLGSSFGHMAIDRAIPTLAEQRNKVALPSSDARYWLARTTEGNPAMPDDSSVAMLKVETYRPRNPFKGTYPNITDFETVSGKLATGRYTGVAAGMLWIALHDFNPGSIVSAYGEAPNQDGLDFYHSLGFTDDKKYQPEPKRIGEDEMQYVHLVAESVRDVRVEIARNYLTQVNLWKGPGV